MIGGFISCKRSGASFAAGVLLTLIGFVLCWPAIALKVYFARMWPDYNGLWSLLISLFIGFSVGGFVVYEIFSIPLGLSIFALMKMGAKRRPSLWRLLVPRIVLLAASAALTW